MQTLNATQILHMNLQLLFRKSSLKTGMLLSSLLSFFPNSYFFLIEFFFIVLSIYWSVSVKALVAQSCVTLCDPMDCSPTGSSVHWYSPGKYTGVSSLFQGIFATQSLNLDLLRCRHSHQELVALRCFLSFYCTGK